MNLNQSSFEIETTTTKRLYVGNTLFVYFVLFHTHSIDQVKKFKQKVEVCAQYLLFAKVTQVGSWTYIVACPIECPRVIGHFNNLPNHKELRLNFHPPQLLRYKLHSQTDIMFNRNNLHWKMFDEYNNRDNLRPDLFLFNWKDLNLQSNCFHPRNKCLSK